MYLRLTEFSDFRHLIKYPNVLTFPFRGAAPIYGIVKKMNPALSTLAHEGVKAYQQKYELIFRRKCSTSKEIWQSDHTELDIYIIDSNGNEKKPWLTSIMDD